METEQVNLRMPKELLSDLDIISKLLKVNKSEWVKTRIAEDVHEEKNRLLMELGTLYAKGIISKNKIRQLVGSDIADEMESIKSISQRSIKSGLRYGKKLRRLHS